MKAVRTREERFDELKKQRKSVGHKMDSAEKKLSKMGSEHKNLAGQSDLLAKLKDEMATLDLDITVEEAAIGDFKRNAVRDWMTLKFCGLVQCSQKGTVCCPNHHLALH